MYLVNNIVVRWWHRKSSQGITKIITINSPGNNAFAHLSSRLWDVCQDLSGARNDRPTERQTKQQTNTVIPAHSFIMVVKGVELL